MLGEKESYLKSYMPSLCCAKTKVCTLNSVCVFSIQFNFIYIMSVAIKVVDSNFCSCLISDYDL